MRLPNLRPMTILALLVVISVACMLALGAAASAQTHEPTSYRDVVKKVLPAVVSVEATTKAATPNLNALRWREDLRIPQEFRKFFDDFQFPFDWPEMPQRGFGSGFIIDSRGVVITNYHVVKGAAEVTVRLQDGTTYSATDIKSDPRTDLAVVRFTPKGSLPHLEFGDSSAMEIGDRVLAVGAPFGFAGSVTSGIISGKGRKLNNTIHEDYLQTDAAINPGNSGGPLVNLDGKVVGVNTAIRSNSGGSQGVGLAIASNVARNIVDKLLKDGTVHRGYLGVQVQRLDPEVGARLGADNKSGVVVTMVLDGSPAAKAGIHAGDILTSVGGTPIKSPIELQQRVVDLPIKKSVNVIVIRDGKSQEFPVTIEDQPSVPAPATKRTHSSTQRSVPGATHIERLGFELSDMTTSLSKQYGLSDTPSGAVITQVGPGGLAAQAGLKPGTLITKVDSANVSSAAEAKRALENASLEKGVLLHVQYPGGGAGYVMIKASLGR